MLKSMTGFGKAECKLTDKKVRIEIKALNSKNLDLNVETASLYREKELEIRNILKDVIVRGKVDITIYYDLTGASNQGVINTETVKEYFLQLKSVADELNIPVSDNLLQSVINLPDVLKSNRQELSKAEWISIEKGIKEALVEFDKFRSQDGKVIEKDFRIRVKEIMKYLIEVEKYEKKRVVKIKDRLLEKLKDVAESSFDENRLEQEMIYFVEKLDITEEKVRLKNHCEYFLENLKTDEPIGKKLGFIVQEMGREINTLGSKANDTDMQKLVILMKDNLEKIKEQVLNIL